MTEFIRAFKFFYQLRGNTLFYLLGIMLCAALFETLGVSLFLPILDGGNLDSPIGKILLQIFDLFGIKYTFSKLLILMVLVFCLRALFLILRTSYIGKITSDLLVELRRDMMYKLFNVDYLYFLSKDTGYINNAITIEFEKIVFAFSMYAQVLLAIIFSAAYLSIPLILNPIVAVMLLLFGLPAALIIRYINQKTKQYGILTSAHSGKLQSILIQSLNQFKYLKATQTQDKVLSKIEDENQLLGKLRFKLFVIQAITTDGFTPFAIIVVVSVLFYQVEILGGDMTQTIFLMVLLYRAMTQLLSVQGSYRKFLTSIGSINIYRTLEQELLENREPASIDKTTPDFDQPIYFKNVSYSYPNSKDILKEVDFCIPPRATVAFVGTSGSGKSTLVTLLTGILTPTKGEILVGRQPYSKIDQEELRRNIGYVTQESVIFNDSIQNNISFWDNQDEELIQQVAANAAIQDFIEELPERYNSLLGDNGLNISGGQRQRISIARELYKNVNLLILDEATSALDIDSERAIQQNIDRLRGKMTVILIAHRLSTIKNSDIIFVLKDGQIIEQGNYQELYDAQGEFRRMIDLQSTNTYESNISSHLRHKNQI